MCLPANVEPLDEADEIAEMVTTERVAVIVHLLTLGRKMTTDQAAQRVGLEKSAAFRMLSKISRVLPVYLVDGKWALFSEEW